MTKARSSQFAEAQREGYLVRISRRFEKSSIRGYVLDIGPKFFLFAIVGDRIWFDGFACFRMKDVKEIKPEPNAKFVEAALKKRSERLMRKPRVSVASLEKLLPSANRLFPLITIHREEVDPDVCWIGRVVAVRRGYLSMLEINPDANWDKKPAEYKLSEITQVNFGGGYENALHLVGGGIVSRRLASRVKARQK